MPRTEEQIQELVHEMYMAAESADLNVDPEAIRSERRRRGVPLPDVKVLVLVAAAVILIVVGIVVANGSPSHRSTVAEPTTTSSTLATGNTVAVPNAVGQSLSDATTALKGIGLNVTITNVVNNAAYGTVLSQSPVAGSQVSRGSAVSLVVSNGPSDVRVPNVVGLSQSQAGNVLGEAGLNIGAISEAKSTQFAAGIVISGSPAAGTTVHPGSSVDLVVSQGP